MARFVSRFTAGVAMAAALSMAATPAFAAPLPQAGRQMPVVGQAAPTWSIDSETAHRSWRGRGGWHRDRGGIDAGDVLAGVLILGGIAAIASAASKSDKDRDYREDYPDRQDYPYRESYPYPGAPPNDRYDYTPPQRGYSAGGIDNAVNLCVDQVERGSDRVASVDNASRTASGWEISGQLSAGGNFSCSIDNDGRIRNVDVGGGYGGASYDQGSGGQWNDDAYARARAQNGYPASYVSGG